jgi:hypothetical protein
MIKYVSVGRSRQGSMETQQMSTSWRSGSLEDMKRRLGRLSSFKAAPKRIGAGQYGVVDAHTLDNGETVAIKTLKSTASDLDILQFHTEKRVLQGLSHEYVPAFHSPPVLTSNSKVSVVQGTGVCK